MNFQAIMTRCGAGTLAAAFIVATAGSARAADQALIDAARKEGTVVWYSTLIVNQLVRPMAEAFEKKYPGIAVKYSRTPAGEMALKLQNEIRAHSVQADVFDANSAFFQAMPLDNLVEYKAQAAESYPDNLKDPKGRFTAVNVFTMATGINTNLVPEAERPKTYEDLLDPKWKGKMAWTTDLTPNGPPGFIGNILTTMGQEKGMAYLEKLAKQDVANVPASQRVVLDQVISGQYAIGLMIFNHHTVISAKKGAPVTWLKIEPLISTGNYVGLIKNSPHPNAGKLFEEFLLSKDGQTVLQKANYLPADPDVPAAEPSLKPKQGGFKATVITNEMALAKLPEWIAVYKKLFK
jgi:iron(III) transport system substrate-binding protein